MSKQSGQISSPEATGGAGIFFEQHVNATFLALLLVRGIPPVLTDCQLEEVHFQTEHLGWKTDDMLLVGLNGAGERRQLAGQMKKTFTVSSKNEECQKTFIAFWKDFQDASHFNRDRDRLTIITLRGTDTLLRRLNALLDCGRASISATDFSHRVTMDGYLHQTARQHAIDIRTIVELTAGETVSDDEFWRFLKVIHVLSFDLNTPTAQTEAGVKTLLAHTTSEQDKLGAAAASWRELLELAGSAMPNAWSYTRERLPTSLRQRHSGIGTAEQTALQALKDHSATIFNGIRDSIGDTLVLRRDQLVTQLLERLEEDRVIVVSGPAGYGKSVLGKHTVAILHKDHFSFAFRAEEFATSHLDETLHRAQVGVGAERLLALLSGQGRKLLVVESVERLLEASVRDGFSDLLGLAKRDESWRVILTCRDYSVDVVRSSLLEHASLPHTVVSIPPLTDSELNQAVDTFPKLRRPVTNPALRKLFHNPYLLDKAARMEWPEDQPLPQDERSFRRKFWRELVREDHRNMHALPQRREQAFIEIALRRARALSLFAPCNDLDQEAVAQLRNNNLIASPEATDTLAAPAHDVLEDWAILQWLEQRFAHHEGATRLLTEDIGGFPAIRRTFRKWLGEKLECETETADAFVLSAIKDDSLPAHFRDDTIVCALLSSSAASFLERHRGLLLENERHLLLRVMHLLRVACKTTPSWWPFGQLLPALFFAPHGTAWAAVLRIVNEELDTMLPENASLILDLIEDWAASVSLWEPYPEGSEEAGKIAFGLLPYFDDYGRNNMRKRALQVIAKIPRADSDTFLGLVDRACTYDQDDSTASDFAELLLDGRSGEAVCRDFPDATIRMAESQFCLCEEELSTERGFDFSYESEPIFGIRDHWHTHFFPPSAIRGPFLPLLQNHPQKGVDFIVRLMNHASAWYGERKWHGNILQPAVQVRLPIPGEGDVIQWADSRLWGLFRGTSGELNLLQTALMALESWLLEICEVDEPYVESLLLKLLKESNNVAVTAVVASICNAHPEKAGRAGLAVLTCREFFEMDRVRMVQESSPPDGLANLMPTYGAEETIYNSERRRSDSRPHRKHDLEWLAFKLQLSEQREAVWRMLDAYRAVLPEAGIQTEGDRLWRLALYRMDVRNHQPQRMDAEVVEEISEQVTTETEEVRPTPVYDDLQEMLDRRMPVHVREQADMALCFWGMAAWRQDGGDTVDTYVWRERLVEARQRTTDGTPITDVVRGGPGFVAAVCVRDHWQEMEREDRDWCVNMLIAEIERDCDSDDMSVRVSRSSTDPSRPAAYVLPRLLCESPPDAPDERVIRAIAKSLTHAVSEVVAYAAEGVGQYLHGSRREFMLRCVGALARQARLVGNLIASEEHLPDFERRQSADLKRISLPETRNLIVGGSVSVEAEMAQLDLNDWPGQEAAGAILAVLFYCPDDVMAEDVYGRLACHVVKCWEADRNANPHRLNLARHFFKDWEADRDHIKPRRRNPRFESECLKRLAYFVMRLPVRKALSICEPLFNAVDMHPREVARFVEDLVVIADQTEGNSPFWNIWQAFADRVQTARWMHRLDSRYASDAELLRTIFFGLSCKDGVCHWQRLEGFADRVDTLFESLPPCATVLDAYCRFLYTIREQSLPRGFVVVAKRLQAGDACQMLSKDNTVFYLESLLRRFIYSEPPRLKSNAEVRWAVLTLLDQLVDSGSSAAYRMRDDFVTPIPQQNA
jgi:hypothetical protein